jgi:hypothetical protein
MDGRAFFLTSGVKTGKSFEKCRKNTPLWWGILEKSGVQNCFDKRLIILATPQTPRRIEM